MDKSFSQNDLMTFWTTLAQRTCAGHNLCSSLEVLVDQLAGSPLATVTQDIMDDLNRGSTVTNAMRRHPDAFREHVLCMVEGGERAGILDRMFVFIVESAWRCPDCILG